jgi:hypothetical protein
LNLTGSPAVTLSGQTNCTATVSVQPPATVAAASSANFTVLITPSGIGAWQVTVSIVNDDSDENPYDWIVSGTTVPTMPKEIDVTRGPTPIADGGTDTGLSVAAGTPVPFTYTISQLISMGGALNLTGTPLVALSGFTNCTAAVTALPTTPVMGSTNFTVTVTGTAAGSGFTFTVTIWNDDTDENPYDWTVSGNVTGTTQPEMDVLRSSTPVADGGTDTGLALSAGVPTAVTYTIQNSGSATLNLTGTPEVVLSSPTNCSVALTTPPASTVGAGGSTTFTVTVTGTAAGAFDFSLSIPNDDGNENPYDWIASGTMTAVPLGEMDVYRAGTPIADDGTDLNHSIPASTPTNITYTVDNPGTGLLLLSGTPPVSVFAEQNCTATVTAQPPASVVASGSTTFTVSVTVTAADTPWRFTLFVPNSDFDENPYDWIVGSPSASPPPPERDGGSCGGPPAGGREGPAGWLGVLLPFLVLLAGLAVSRVRAEVS